MGDVNNIKKMLSQKEFAEVIGKSGYTVSNYIKLGKISNDCIVMDGKRRLINVDMAISELSVNLDSCQVNNAKIVSDRKNGIGVAGGTSKEMSAESELISTAQFDEGATFLEAQRLDRLYSASLKKLDYEKKAGLLVDRESYDAKNFDLARRTRDAILNVPDRIAAQLAAETSPVEIINVLMDELIKALEELSNG